MLVNYVPGEECRVAIVEDGKLERFTSEKFANQSRVGNIYVGKVINVEPAIQAARSSISAWGQRLPPRERSAPAILPGRERRRDRAGGPQTTRRPPIQAALRRGERSSCRFMRAWAQGPHAHGISSSIPGRFLVMMPQMDKVMISRKVGTRQRRKMREVLDQLDLRRFKLHPATAGLERTKMSSKRDPRALYKDMVAGGPRGVASPACSTPRATCSSAPSATSSPPTSTRSSSTTSRPCKRRPIPSRLSPAHQHQAPALSGQDPHLSRLRGRGADRPHQRPRSAPALGRASSLIRPRLSSRSTSTAASRAIHATPSRTPSRPTWKPSTRSAASSACAIRAASSSTTSSTCGHASHRRRSRAASANASSATARTTISTISQFGIPR